MSCVKNFIPFIELRILLNVPQAILKNMSVGGNPSCCNLEALLEKFFSGFLEIYQNIF